MSLKTKFQKRSCDGCRACCVALRIDSKPGYSTRLDTGEDLAKPAGIACRYLEKSGCTIYQNRPGVCRAFFCDWMRKKSSCKDKNPLEVGFFSVRGKKFILGNLV